MTKETPTSWEADLGITSADIRKTVNVEKLRAVILKEKFLSERQGAEKVEAKYADIFAWLLGERGDFPNLAEKPHYRFRTELRERLSRTQEVEGEPFDISKP